MSCSRDFDWDDVVDDIVVPEQAAIAVYTNPKGNVVIRQAGYYGPDEDMWVVLAADHAPAVAEAILRAAGQRTAADQVAPPKDRTAAERQRRYRERRNGEDRDVTDGDGAMPLLLEHSSDRGGAAVEASAK